MRFTQLVSQHMYFFLINHLAVVLFILCVCSVVSDSATPWTVTYQAPLSIGFSREEYWSELPFPSPEDLPDAGIKIASLVSPALAGGFFNTGATWEAPCFRNKETDIKNVNYPPHP